MTQEMISKKEAQRNVLIKNGLIVGFFAILLLIIMNFTTPHRAFVSAEVQFADPSKGLQIIPASCPSATPGNEANAGYGGYGVWVAPGANGNSIIAAGRAFCIANSIGSYYYLPLNSTGEIDSFRAHEGSMPGVYEVYPPDGNYNY